MMSLIDNKNYPESERLKIRQCFNVTACATRMYTKILPLITDLHQSGNIDYFYKAYYMTFLLNTSFYITDDLHTPIPILILILRKDWWKIYGKAQMYIIHLMSQLLIKKWMSFSI